MLEFALETRAKIREVRAAVEYYEQRQGALDEGRAAAARAAIAGLRGAYRKCRLTFIETDELMIGRAEAILRKFGPVAVTMGSPRRSSIPPKAKRRR